MGTLPRSMPLHAYAQSFAEGGARLPRESLHPGNHATVGQVFSHPAGDGRLPPVAQGVRAARIAGRPGMRAHTPARAPSSIAEPSGKTIDPHGASATDLHGLTRQASVRPTRLTPGRISKSRLVCVEAPPNHVCSWMLVLGSRPAGTTVCALAWIGPLRARTAMAVPGYTSPLLQWHELATSCSMLAFWPVQAIGRESAHG